MRKRRKLLKFKRIITLILLFILGGIVYSFGVSVTENIKIKRTTKSFISRATFEKEEFIQEKDGITHIRRYYEVPRETYEEDGVNVFLEDRETLGQRGDIFVTKQSPFPNVPVLHQFISSYFGGHAAISDGNGYFYETYGFAEGDNMFDVIFHNGVDEHDFSVTVSKNRYKHWQDPYKRSNPYYFDAYYTSEFYVLRVKDAQDEVILNNLFDFLDDKVENLNLYNYLFFLNMKHKYYCTDLVSRAYSHALDQSTKKYAKRLNDDGFITSVQDLILSKDTYIAAYVIIKKEGDTIIENYYYLKNIDNI